MKFLLLIKSNKKILLLTVLAAAFVISLVCFFLQCRGRKYTFTYPVANSTETVYELRTVSWVKGQKSINRYINELMLGPTVARGKPLFALNSQILFCFVRGNQLYINLSEDAIYTLKEGDNLAQSYQLLCKNVMDNFPGVKSVNLFIDGNSVFQNEKIR